MFTVYSMLKWKVKTLQAVKGGSNLLKACDSERISEWRHARFERFTNICPSVVIAPLLSLGTLPLRYCYYIIHNLSLSLDSYFYCNMESW